MNKDNLENQEKATQAPDNTNTRPKTEEELFREEIINFFSKYNTEDNETLTSKEIINLSKKENIFKNLSSLSTDKLDIYINGMSEIASGDKFSENLRLNASMVMLEVSGFFYKDGDSVTDYEKNKRNEFKDHPAVKKSLNKLLNEPAFIHENRDFIISILQNKGHQLNSTLNELISNSDISNRVFKINYIEIKTLEKEIENLNKYLKEKTFTSEQELYYKEQIASKRKEIENINRLNQQLPHKNLSAIENDKALNSDLKKLFNDKKGDYYKSPELLTLIQTRYKSNELSEAEALYYHYISLHQKRIDNMKKYGVSIKEDVKYKIFSKNNEDFLQHEGKSLYSKTWNPMAGVLNNSSTYEIPPSKFKEQVIQEVIDKLLLKNHLATVNISFGSNIEEEEREKTAIVAMKEMRDFLIKHPDFKNEKQVIEQIEKSLKVEGIDTKDLINKVFPHYKEMTLINSVEKKEEKEYKSLSQFKEECLILIQHMDDSQKQADFFKNEIKPEIINFLNKDDKLSSLEKNQIKEDIEKAIKDKDYVSMVEILEKISKTNPDFKTNVELSEKLSENNSIKQGSNMSKPSSPSPRPSS